MQRRQIINFVGQPIHLKGCKLYLECLLLHPLGWNFVITSITSLALDPFTTGLLCSSPARNAIGCLNADGVPGRKVHSIENLITRLRTLIAVMKIHPKGVAFIIVKKKKKDLHFMTFVAQRCKVICSLHLLIHCTFWYALATIMPIACQWVQEKHLHLNSACALATWV